MKLEVLAVGTFGYLCGVVMARLQAGTVVVFLVGGTMGLIAYCVQLRVERKAQEQGR